MRQSLPSHTKRLAQLVLRPGGITADEAVAAAERSLEGLRDRGMSEMAATLGRMNALAAELVPDGGGGRGSELYALSNSLVGVAGVFGRAGLGEIALSLCTLVERLLLAGRWDAQAVRLHLDSMRLVLDGTVSEAEMKTISAALRQVVDRVRLPAARPANSGSGAVP